MLNQDEFLSVVDSPGMPAVPRELLDYREVWDKPEQAGELEGVRNVREIKRKNAVKFMERMAILEGQYLEACKAFAEAEKARFAAMTHSSGTTSPGAEQIPDEGTARLREIGEQVLRGLGLEPPDEA